MVQVFAVLVGGRGMNAWDAATSGAGVVVEFTSHPAFHLSERCATAPAPCKAVGGAQAIVAVVDSLALGGVDGLPSRDVWRGAECGMRVVNNNTRARLPCGSQSSAGRSKTKNTLPAARIESALSRAFRVRMLAVTGLRTGAMRNAACRAVGR
ncbi:hypothetical protein PMIN07_007732 [Paraphaeosphaeria minitans]